MTDADRRGTLAPIIKHPDGSWEWAVPQVALDAWDGVTAPYDALTGKLDPLSPEATRRSLNAAGFAMGAPAIGAVERVAAGAASREGAEAAGVRLAKGPLEYAPPKYPQRPFKADYPDEVPSDATGKLQADIDGQPLKARYIAGRTHAQMPDAALGERAVADIVRSGTGSGYQSVPRAELFDGAGSGGTYYNPRTGRPNRVVLADDIHPDDVLPTLAHETGHVIDQIVGNIPTVGLEDELAQIYHANQTGQRWSAKPRSPQDMGYPPEEVPQEYIAEAVRTYMTNPNTMKTVAPKTAERIRWFVNDHPELSDTIQFNQGGSPGAAIGAAASSGEGKGRTAVPEFTIEQKRALALAAARRRRAATSGQRFREDGVPIGDDSSRGSDMSGVDRSGVIGAGGVAQVGAGMPARDEMNPDAAMRMVANGMTFGLADKAAGAMDAATGQAASYDAGVKAQRAETEKVRQDNPVAAGAAEMAGGLVTGVGAARNGLTIAGRVGKGLLPRIAGYGAEGAVYGAAHGAGNTYSEEAGDYLDAAGKGAKTGAIIGGALPAAGSALGAAARAGQAVAGPVIEGAGRTASALLRTAAQADEAGLRALPKMGDEAMLVDAGPAMLGLGQGAGTGTGAGRAALVNTLRERDAGTGQRLATVLDDQLGPAPIPSRVRAGLDESKEQIGEQYGRPFADAAPVDTADLANSLDWIAGRVRGPAQAAVRKVRGYLDRVRGEGDIGPAQLDTDPRTLFETRQAIDGLLTGEADPKVIRQLSTARQSVDELLQHAVPRIKEVDGKFAEVARQDEALTRGGQVFDTGKTATRPAELADEISQGALPQGEFVGPSGAPHRLRQGARAEIDRLVGTNVNDLNTLERRIGRDGDWNRQKLSIVFGAEPADALTEALTTNRRFRQSFQDIVQNSQTAQRQAAQKSMDGEIDLPVDATLTGATAAGGRALWRALMGMSREATKDEVGKLLAKQGPGAQALVQALIERTAIADRNAAVTRYLVENSGNASAGGLFGGRRASR